MARRQEAWTPYGLEAIRIRHLRRRRLRALLMALGLLALWFGMVETTTFTETEIFANGEKAGRGIQIDAPPPPEEERPVTVSLSPGRVTRADTSQEVGQESVQRAQAPIIQRAAPFPWMGYLMLYGPFLLLGAAIWFLARRQGNHDQVNYGIYKGAMPLEMITASARQHVLTRKEARWSIFGKRRRDYVPAEVLLVERVEQEGDA